jgi:hypothetical protein
MNDSNKSVKSKGVVLFATNTDTVDYVAIAHRAERLINHYLGLPVTMVEGTRRPNRRYNVDSGQFEQWNNTGRSMAYDLSPYDQTILLDCDYLVFDDNLLKVLESNVDYKIARHNRFVDHADHNTMGKHSLPFLWATIVVFDRTPKSQMLFDLVARIERNYAYYCRLYNVRDTIYRNDYAFTMADNILNGYCQDNANYLPWPMISVANPIDSLELRDQKLLLKVKDQAHVLPKQNLHILSKAFLMSDACERLIEAAIDA